MPITAQTKDEKPVFITTFKSVQNEEGETVIETENKKISQAEGVLVEEVLSDTETIEDQAEQPTPILEIIEVNDITGTFLNQLLFQICLQLRLNRNSLKCRYVFISFTHLCICRQLEYDSFRAYKGAIISVLSGNFT